MQLVIFDCDGVLVESEAIYISAEIEYLSRHGVHFEKQAYMRQFMGMAPREWKEKLGDTISEQLGEAIGPEFFDKLDNFTMQRFKEELTAVDGARAAIAQLEHPRCVASDLFAEG